MSVIKESILPENSSEKISEMGGMVAAFLRSAATISLFSPKIQKREKPKTISANIIILKIFLIKVLL